MSHGSAPSEHGIGAAGTGTIAPRGDRLVRLGFVGLGWIGRHRLQKAAQHSQVEVVALADPSAEASRAARELAPEAVVVDCLEQLLEQELDGVVIATPSAMHAEQACAAFARKLAVYCQKPLARNASETRQVLRAAAAADRLLGVDYCYRHLRGVDQMRRMLAAGQLGKLFHIDLTFHNAYGPDKAWFRDLQRSGGGCVIDLGTHLVDLALWLCDYPPARAMQSQLYRQGRALAPPIAEVEDAAFAQWIFPGDIQVRLACSWNLSAGCDAQISAAFYGSEGALVLRNLEGSFYDFTVEHCRGTQRQTLAQPPDDWGGRSLQQWVDRLAVDPSYDPQAEHFLEVATVIDGIYAR